MAASIYIQAMTLIFLYGMVVMSVLLLSFSHWKNHYFKRQLIKLFIGKLIAVGIACGVLSNLFNLQPLHSAMAVALSLQLLIIMLAIISLKRRNKRLARQCYL